MSEEKEKYLGESLLSQQPKKKMSLVLKDKTVTAQKLADKAVTPQKVSDDFVNKIVKPSVDKAKADLQNQIESISVGGLAISNEWGDNPNIAISQKTLTEAFNNIYDAIGEDLDNIDVLYFTDYLEVKPEGFEYLTLTYSGEDGDITYIVQDNVFALHAGSNYYLSWTATETREASGQYNEEKEGTLVMRDDKLYYYMVESTNSDINVDNSLDADSDNPVSNKAVCAGFASIAPLRVNLSIAQMQAADSYVCQMSQSLLTIKTAFSSGRQVIFSEDRIFRNVFIATQVPGNNAPASSNALCTLLSGSKFYELKPWITSDSCLLTELHQDADSALSTESVNPIQNKVVTGKFNEISSTVNSISSSVGALNSKVQNLEIDGPSLLPFDDIFYGTELPYYMGDASRVYEGEGGIVTICPNLNVIALRVGMLYYGEWTGTAERIRSSAYDLVNDLFWRIIDDKLYIYKYSIDDGTFTLVNGSSSSSTLRIEEIIEGNDWSVSTQEYTGADGEVCYLESQKKFVLKVGDALYETWTANNKVSSSEYNNADLVYREANNQLYLYTPTENGLVSNLPDVAPPLIVNMTLGGIYRQGDARGVGREVWYNYSIPGVSDENKLRVIIEEFNRGRTILFKDPSNNIVCRSTTSRITYNSNSLGWNLGVIGTGLNAGEITQVCIINWPEYGYENKIVLRTIYSEMSIDDGLDYNSPNPVSNHALTEILGDIQQRFENIENENEEDMEDNTLEKFNNFADAWKQEFKAEIVDELRASMNEGFAELQRQIKAIGNLVDPDVYPVLPPVEPVVVEDEEVPTDNGPKPEQIRPAELEEAFDSSIGIRGLLGSSADPDDTTNPLNKSVNAITTSNVRFALDIPAFVEGLGTNAVPVIDDGEDIPGTGYYIVTGAKLGLSTSNSSGASNATKINAAASATGTYANCVGVELSASYYVSATIKPEKDFTIYGTLGTNSVREGTLRFWTVGCSKKDVNTGSAIYTTHSLVLKNLNLNAPDTTTISGQGFKIWININDGIDQIQIVNCNFDMKCYAVSIYGEDRTPFENNMLISTNCINHLLVDSNIAKGEFIRISDYRFVKSCRFLSNTITNVTGLGIRLFSETELSTYGKTMGYASCPVWIVGNTVSGAVDSNGYPVMRRKENTWAAEYYSPFMVSKSARITYVLHNNVSNFISGIGVDENGKRHFLAHYDIFAICSNIYYCNNTITNFVRFDDDRTDFGTFKAKGDGVPSIYKGNGNYVPVTRYYAFNTYSVDEEVLERCWGTRSNQSKYTELEAKIDDNIRKYYAIGFNGTCTDSEKETEQVDTFHFVHNTMEYPYWDNARTNKAKEVYIENNVFKCDWDPAINLSFPQMFSFYSNTVTIKDNDFGGGSDYGITYPNFWICSVRKFNDGMPPKVIVEGNLIKDGVSIKGHIYKQEIQKDGNVVFTNRPFNDILEVSSLDARPKDPSIGEYVKVGAKYYKCTKGAPAVLLFYVSPFAATESATVSKTFTTTLKLNKNNNDNSVSVGLNAGTTTRGSIAEKLAAQLNAAGYISRVIYENSGGSLKRYLLVRSNHNGVLPVSTIFTLPNTTNSAGASIYLKSFTSNSYNKGNVSLTWAPQPGEDTEWAETTLAQINLEIAQREANGDIYSNRVSSQEGLSGSAGTSGTEIVG